VSCNCFFYEVGRLLGIDNINKYCKMYGLGQPTGIELPEAKGVLGDTKYKQSTGRGVWTGGDTIATAIGQAYNQFTPLQISNYISTIVNGGTRYSVHLLHSVKSFSGEEKYRYEDTVLDKLNVGDKNYKTIIEAMSSVIEDGSASKEFVNFPIPIGGKTGTAQISRTQSNNAVFVAFAPLDSPEIVISCVIERGASGLNAAQSVRTAMECYFGLGQWAKNESDEQG
jgi:penicillin-binding protein 2